jgi:hypothetical protein
VKSIKGHDRWQMGGRKTKLNIIKQQKTAKNIGNI